MRGCLGKQQTIKAAAPARTMACIATLCLLALSACGLIVGNPVGDYVFPSDASADDADVAPPPPPDSGPEAPPPPLDSGPDASCPSDCSVVTPGSVCSSNACSCPSGTFLVGNNCLQGALVPLSRTGWIATASTTGADAPSNALDGSECTRFSTDAPQTSGEWFELDLGSITMFSEIVLDAYNDPDDSPAGYEVYVSDDGSTWGSAIATGSGSSAVTTIAFSEQAARFLRVQLTATSNYTWWSIDEVKVLSAHPPTGTPVPRVQSPWMATVSADAGTGSLAIDDDLTTYFNSEQNQSTDMSFAVNMGSPVTFTQVTMDQYLASTSCSTYGSAYAVSVSNDGLTWSSPIATGFGSPLTTATFSAVTAQYVRVQLTAASSSVWEIAEFNVYTPSQ